jgi:hypothetical protein
MLLKIQPQVEQCKENDWTDLRFTKKGTKTEALKGKLTGNHLEPVWGGGGGREKIFTGGFWVMHWFLITYYSIYP